MVVDGAEFEEEVVFDVPCFIRRKTFFGGCIAGILLVVGGCGGWILGVGCLLFDGRRWRLLCLRCIGLRLCGSGYRLLLLLLGMTMMGWLRIGRGWIMMSMVVMWVRMMAIG